MSIAEAVVLALLIMLVVGLLRSHAEILRTLHDAGLDGPADARDARSAPSATAGPAVDVEGRLLDGTVAAVGVRGTEHHTLLAFLSATCTTCAPFWEALPTGVTSLPPNTLPLVVVHSGDNLARLHEMAPPDLSVVVSDKAWVDYDVPGSPHFVYVDGPSGRVLGEGTAHTWEQVIDLLGHAMAGSAPPAESSGRDNPQRIDSELLAAGIGPGHPSLYPGGSAAVADGSDR